MKFDLVFEGGGAKGMVFVGAMEVFEGEGCEYGRLLGTSAGATSALQFALRHPDRCSALVLLSAIARRKPVLPPFFRAAVAMQEVLTRYDFIWWPAYRLGLRSILASNGLSAAEVEMVMNDRRKRKSLAAIYRPFMTASLRRPGVLIDGLQIEELSAGFVDQIATPTLVAHSRSDPLAPFDDAQWLSQNIPGAKFLPVESGGHVFFVVRAEQVIPEITSFLEAHAA